jgi:transcriptional regulator with XRE-family HTH domain
MKKDKKFDTQLGKKIKELRLKSGLSQTDLAKKLKYDSATAISLIENGSRSLRSKDLVRIKSTFNVSYDELLGKEIKRMVDESVDEQIAETMKKLNTLMKLKEKQK